MPDTLLDAETATVSKTKSLPSRNLKTSERSQKKKKKKRKERKHIYNTMQRRGADH